MICFAHRGASASAPANTLPAFILARQIGCTRYELDVHLTRDGALAVYHDYNLASGTDCSQDIKDISSAELAACTVRHSFSPNLQAHPPLLQEVLPVVAPDLECLNIEIKNEDNRYPGIERVLLDLLEKNGSVSADKILFSSFDYPTLLRLRALAPAARIGWLTRDFDAQAARKLGAFSVHINQTRLTQNLTRICHQQNQYMFVYTVNEIQAAHRVKNLGADGIFTDRPDLFINPKKPAF